MSLPSISIVPLVRRREPGDHPERRRLARARRTEERDELAAPDLEVHVVDGHDRAEELPEVAEHERRAVGRPHRCRPARSRPSSPSRHRAGAWRRTTSRSSSRTRRHDEERRRDRGDRRVDDLADLLPHLDRERPEPGRGQEDRDDDLVPRGDEGEDRAGEHAGQDDRQRDPPEGPTRVGPQVRRGQLEVPVHRPQAGRHADDDERQGERRVGERRARRASR